MRCCKASERSVEVSSDVHQVSHQFAAMSADGNFRNTRSRTKSFVTEISFWEELFHVIPYLLRTPSTVFRIESSRGTAALKEGNNTAPHDLCFLIMQCLFDILISTVEPNLVSCVRTADLGGVFSGSSVKSKLSMNLRSTSISRLLRLTGSCGL